jgi:hypothetical protein
MQSTILSLVSHFLQYSSALFSSSHDIFGRHQKNRASDGQLDPLGEVIAELEAQSVIFHTYSVSTLSSNPLQKSVINNLDLSACMS